MEELQAGVKSTSRLFTWEEIKFFSSQGHPQQERWLVIDRKVYDIDKFYHHHPGGSKVIRHYTGQDATDAFVAFHPDKALVRKYMRSLLIGELAPDQPSFEPHKNKLLVQDFRELCSTVERMGLLKPSGLFFFLNFLQIPLFQAASWIILWYFRMSLMPLLISAVLMATSMQQSLVLQHDLGHLSVFCKTKWNHLAQFIVMGSFAGFSCSWWNHLHGQHHAKTNCFRKDPDVNLHPFLFTLGKKLSVELGMKKKKFLPYNHQHKYFFITVPPFLFSTYIQFSTFYHVIQRKQWLDLACVLSYFIWLFLLYKPLLELKALLGYFVLIRYHSLNPTMSLALPHLLFLVPLGQSVSLLHPLLSLRPLSWNYTSSRGGCASGRSRKKPCLICLSCGYPLKPALRWLLKGQAPALRSLSLSLTSTLSSNTSTSKTSCFLVLGRGYISSLKEEREAKMLTSQTTQQILLQTKAFL